MGFEMTTPILVVDDDPKIVSLVRTYLEREGFRVTTAGDGRAALSSIEEAPPRLIVLDLMLPELDGMTVMRRVRERSAVPVVMLSARGSAADRVYGISEGADDYLPKPFSPAELVVRVKAVLRRVAPQRGDERGTIALDDLEVDLDRVEVRRDGHIVPLTPAEFRLLAALLLARGRVLTRQALLDALYGEAQGDALERTVDVHIGRLRDKLDEPAGDPRYIVTVRGAGYRAKCA
ncbi:MAG TPA: response regulator transcription factor [Candidatus Dormibacteraeota bacterium]|jgi:DNA-binding response OmpR family regulator|nr:response regulator transcription factor [Candidatus Dormibacteraeota bacterium]